MNSEEKQITHMDMKFEEVQSEISKICLNIMNMGNSIPNSLSYIV
jgi:hypothetical protein